MKQLKTLAIALVLFISTQVSAQSKMAHLNSQEVMASMTSYADAVKKLDAFQNEIAAELQAMNADFGAHSDCGNNISTALNFFAANNTSP